MTTKTHSIHFKIATEIDDTVFAVMQVINNVEVIPTMRTCGCGNYDKIIFNHNGKTFETGETHVGSFKLMTAITNAS